MQQNNSDVDINVLVRLYHQKLAQLSNENVLLEAKLQTLVKDFTDEKNTLLSENLELQEKLDVLSKKKSAE
jgi:hypothetical protein